MQEKLKKIECRKQEFGDRCSYDILINNILMGTISVSDNIVLDMSLTPMDTETFFEFIKILETIKQDLYV